MKLNKINNHQYRVGSNQHVKRLKTFRRKKISTRAMVCASLILLVSFFAILHYTAIGIGIVTRITKAWERETFIWNVQAPTIQKAYAAPKVASISATLSPTPTEHDLITAYINQVFGNESSKAFKLLSCENHALNPQAVNDNTKWGGIGQDIGVFQINTVWQGVSNKAFLYDWRINVDIAHNIYTRDGHSFKLWTCGKKLGI